MIKTRSSKDLDDSSWQFLASNHILRRFACACALLRRSLRRRPHRHAARSSSPAPRAAASGTARTRALAPVGHTLARSAAGHEVRLHRSSTRMPPAIASLALHTRCATCLAACRQNVHTATMLPNFRVCRPRRGLLTAGSSSPAPMCFYHIISSTSYTLLDCGGGARLEQAGGRRLIRSCPSATWPRGLPNSEWRADLTFDAEAGWRGARMPMKRARLRPDVDANAGSKLQIVLLAHRCIESVQEPS
eukprot:6209677-Pleurochrysis_carterae.AAC.4